MRLDITWELRAFGSLPLSHTHFFPDLSLAPLDFCGAWFSYLESSRSSVACVIGNYRPYLYDEDFPFFIVPFYEKAYPLRVWPVRKRLVQEFTTKDGKPVEVSEPQKGTRNKKK